MSLLSHSPSSLRGPGGQERCQGLEKGQCHSNCQKGQEGRPRELQAGQPHLHPGKGDGASHSRGHHQASGGKEGYQEWSAWI